MSALPQPGGFEGVDAASELLQPSNLAVALRFPVRPLLIDFETGRARL